MKNHIKHFAVLLTFAVLVFGCEKKSETPETKQENTVKEETQPVEMPSVDSAMTEEKEPEPEKPVVQIPDLEGKWVGKFESHAASLKITEQTDTDFKASLSVSYRQPMNKKLIGKIDLATNKITMSDVEKSRTESSYSAKLSDSKNKISGTSTMKVGGNQAKFIFTKK